MLHAQLGKVVVNDYVVCGKQSVVYRNMCIYIYQPTMYCVRDVHGICERLR